MRRNDNFVNGKEKIKKLKKIIEEKDKALNEKDEIIKMLTKMKKLRNLPWLIYGPTWKIEKISLKRLF